MGQLLSSLPIGAKIKFGSHKVNSETAMPIVWIVADKNHSGYPSNSVTLIAEKIIDLRAYDARETDSIDDSNRAYGNIDYSYSNINQWLNSEATGGEWFSKQHTKDVEPNSVYTMYETQYTNRPGFLYHFTEVERQALLPTTLVNQRNTSTSGSVVAKVFLPSAWETIGTFTVADGSTKFKYFETSAPLAFPTQQLVTNTPAESSAKPTSTTTYWTYWTRSTTTNSVQCVGKTSANSTAYPYYGNVGVRPCVNLSYNVKMSTTVDSDGCYTIQSNVIPTISGENGNIGEKNIGFTQTYSVNDGDGDTVTVTEYIDNVMHYSYVATNGANNKFIVEGLTWLKLTNGTHTLKIVASDGFSEAVRTYTFVKNVTTFVVQRIEPIPSTTQPKSIIVTLVKHLPAEALLKVEVCNNGFDTEPIWEDITNKVIYGRVHNFDNATKEVGKGWGVNIRVTVDRNGGEGACYITEIGGNFE